MLTKTYLMERTYLVDEGTSLLMTESHNDYLARFTDQFTTSTYLTGQHVVVEPRYTHIGNKTIQSGLLASGEKNEPRLAVL